jgi:hypothetical protein
VYDRSLYHYDEGGETHAAALRKGAVLYRLTSLSHCNRTDVLTGLGPEKARDVGRFHGPQQRTSYCANNVLVAIAEVLFHMYRKTLGRLSTMQPYPDIRAAANDVRSLVAFRVDDISDMVFFDSDEVQVMFDPRLRGALIVYPDESYTPFRGFAERLRADRKRGVLYPSARHSQDLCIALFDDETNKIATSPFENLVVDLQLLSESQSISEPLRRCNPMKEKIHPTMGAYRFRDQSAFENAKASGILHPSNIPSEGYVDFVRRSYRSYPADAVITRN